VPSHCEWCRTARATAKVEIEPGRRLSATRYKPAKTLDVCAPCKLRVQRLQAERHEPIEAVRIQ
jgi:hypothetical protein